MMTIDLVILIVAIVLALFVIPWLAGVRYIPHSKVGIVEKILAKS